MSDGSTTAYNQRVYQRLLIAVGAKDTPALVRYLGVAKSTAYDWEKGKRPVPQKWLKKVAKEKGLELRWFFKDEADGVSEATETSDPVSLKFSRLEDKYRRKTKNARQQADHWLEALDKYLDQLDEGKERGG